jgi:hypothetical protein
VRGRRVQIAGKTLSQPRLLCPVLAGTVVVPLTGETKRRKAQFMLMECLPRTLEAYIQAWHDRRAPVPYKQAVAILAGVRVIHGVAWCRVVVGQFRHTHGT